MNLDVIISEFDNYFELFDKNDYDTKYKYIHSYRVKDISNCIARGLNLSEEDILLATVIGLLHDIGRFKQLEMFSNYNDINIDHADLGVETLFENNFIEKFKIDRKYYEIIKFAIKNHNKLDIEKTDDDKKLLHAKIIRDADKIDILKAYSIYKDYNLKEEDNYISEKVNQLFYNKELIKKEFLKNKNDFIVLNLSYVYDINFEFSLKMIKEEKILYKLYNEIKNKKIFQPYFETIIKYLKERTK